MADPALGGERQNLSEVVVAAPERAVKRLLAGNAREEGDVEPIANQVSGSWSSASSRWNVVPSWIEAKSLCTSYGASRSSSPRAARRPAAMTNGSFMVEAA